MQRRYAAHGWKRIHSRALSHTAINAKSAMRFINKKLPADFRCRQFF